MHPYYHWDSNPVTKVRLILNDFTIGMTQSLIIIMTCFQENRLIHVISDLCKLVI